MNKQAIDEKIGEAWKAHYQGRNQDAVAQFLQLTEQVPENIDAYWGLGLSYRHMGDVSRAVDIFRKIVDLVSGKLESDSANYERYFMLSRMAKQHLEQMQMVSSGNQPLESTGGSGTHATD